ncbi:HIT-like protein [Ramaria rubella]|nr:HIT-like protein [Ramaria rubella]
MAFVFKSILSCFEVVSEKGYRGHDGAVKLDHETKPCVFCNITNRPGSFDIFSKDSQMVVFRDRNPAAKVHLLVVPMRHISSVKSLQQEHVPLLKDMELAGHKALDAIGNSMPDGRRLGFHIPPFYSVAHLHLHVHGLPYKSLYRRVKYPIVPGERGKCKGLSWFVEIGQAIDILERGGEIGILPC